MSDSYKRLGDRIPAGGTDDPDVMFDIFLEWAGDAGFDLYPAQEEALLEIMAGRHVILNTPTGSGKSLVALGMHFRALCEGKVSYYTSPIKALASEKFFSLCEELGAKNVGMLTGDASINPGGTIICCTAEVLSNLALRLGDELDASYVVMDEFHYYADPERGVAWQVPLIILQNTRFLLMSATLGDMSFIRKHLDDRTIFTTAEVYSDERPVPLDFEYRETQLHETIEAINETKKTPVYLVNFTQRDCAEVAQSLTSMQLTSKEEKAAIREAIGDTRFTTPYGKEFRRFLNFGIGVHHAGLLPKYRLQVEQLAQKGLLKVISGTDTLGVGVNIPIRTVLFTKLAKYDGIKTGILKVRDFKQISGRAGRKGFDDQGSVICQAPDHVIENRKAELKTAANPKKKIAKKQAKQGDVSWSEDTFKRLIESPPERLKSRFKMTNGMILDLLARDAQRNDPAARNFDSIRSLIRDSHEDAVSQQKLISHSAALVRSLYRAGIVLMVKDTKTAYRWVVVNEDLQVDFSLFHNLSLFLVQAIEGLDHQGPDYALDLLSLVESVLEDPVVILRKQVDRLKTELITRLKAEFVPYDERMNLLDEVTYPQPCSGFIFASFERFAGAHPWVRGDLVKPKSIAREMFEDYMDFSDYVHHHSLQRVEGVLLRYLSQVYKTLDQNVPDLAKTEAVWDVIGYFRAMIERVDTSLIEEWEGMVHPEMRVIEGHDAHKTHLRIVADELQSDPRAFASRVRAEMNNLVRVLARREWDEAAMSVHQGAEDSEFYWPPERFDDAMRPFYEEFSNLVFDHNSRLADKTQITKTGENQYQIIQTLVDPDGENLWCIEAIVDLNDPSGLEGPVIMVKNIGT